MTKVNVKVTGKIDKFIGIYKSLRNVNFGES